MYIVVVLAITSHYYYIQDIKECGLGIQKNTVPMAK